MENEIKSYEILEEENKELKGIMRKLCHEMGNALTLLGGSLFYLENDLNNNNNKNAKLITLKEDYTYICNLFGDLREYNRAEVAQKDKVNFSWIIENIVDVFDKLNTDIKAKLEIKCRDDIESVEILADKIKLRQVLVNVIKNSIEAMEGNGVQKDKKIIVTISRDNNEYLNENKSFRDNNEYSNKNKIFIDNSNRFMINDNYEMVHIEIRDNGKGIPEENIDNIFKPLYSYGKKKGTGLGLAVVKKIVEDHCGIIKAVSDKGTGTAMHIYFPILREIEQHI